ncbi:MAG: alpha-hydroxy-acid oxidizing protein [Desulfobacterales bacterium]
MDRPLLWALAAGGKEGVSMLAEEINEEMRRIMPRVGASNPSEVKRDILLRD